MVSRRNKCRPGAAPFPLGQAQNRQPSLDSSVWFSDSYDPSDPPFLVLGSKRTVVALASALETIRGENALTTSTPPEWETTAALVRRLVDGEPWVDARAL